MALETDILTKCDNEEEDLGCYFLQPSSSPYNIAEKVQQANFDLFNSNVEKSKTVKVKFKDELVSFEPDLTDDDVNSIESDHVVDGLSNPGSESLSPTDRKEESQITTTEKTLVRNLANEKAVSYILETVEANVDILEEIEELQDEFEESCEYKTTLRDEFIHNQESKTQHLEEESLCYEESLTESRKLESESTTTDSKTTKTSTKSLSPQEEKVHKNVTHRVGTAKKSLKKQNSRVRKDLATSEIRCKDHCIERIDHSLSMSVKKLDIQEKIPVNLPPLQLHQRNCCDNFKYSNTSRNLPVYNGYRSEYGLTMRQLRKKDRHMEMIRQKEMARQKMIEEYRKLKMQQNEEVFCQWLKEISSRKKQSNFSNPNSSIKDLRSTSNLTKSPTSPKIVNLPNESTENISKTKQLRPKTAGYNEFVPKTNVKKKRRPHTTQSCVYIEVPTEILQKGIQIGDFLVTKTKMMSKKFHILTMS